MMSAMSDTYVPYLQLPASNISPKVHRILGTSDCGTYSIRTRIVMLEWAWDVMALGMLGKWAPRETPQLWVLHTSQVNDLRLIVPLGLGRDRLAREIDDGHLALLRLRLLAVALGRLALASGLDVGTDLGLRLVLFLQIVRLGLCLSLALLLGALGLRLRLALILHFVGHGNDAGPLKPLFRAIL